MQTDAPLLPSDSQFVASLRATVTAHDRLLRRIYSAKGASQRPILSFERISSSNKKTEVRGQESVVRIHPRIRAAKPKLSPLRALPREADIMSSRLAWLQSIRKPV